MIIAIMGITVADAQIIADGYYRVKNADTERYATVVDDYGKVDYNSTSADVGAIWTYKSRTNDEEWNATRINCNPGSIIYAQGNGNNGYRLKCQGADTYNMVGAYLQVISLGGHYAMYASKAGMSKYLFDLKRAGRDSSECIVDASNYKNGSLYWDVYPMTTDGDNYFGMYPTLQKGNDYYLSFYAGFPFSFHSQGMKAYYINKVDKDLKVAVWKEISGEIPASMPILAKCSSQEPTNNRLDIHNNSATAPSDNMLKGVYFCRVERQGATNKHHDCVVNDPQTMRVLGILSDGSLGMKVYGGNYIPKNTAYLLVEAGTPEELKLVTPEEYQQMTEPTEKLLGDANADGTVDVADITTIASYILGKNIAVFSMTNADANEDGVIDVADITTTASIILGTNVKRGDANADGVVDVADITTIAAKILGKTPEKYNAKNADANADGVVDVADITTTAGFILKVKTVKKAVREAIESVKKVKKDIVIPAEYEAIW